tara:strand:+ start:12377 stop:12835 length:459 start_codon:yes stop_codon:yes gene_type:complete
MRKKIIYIFYLTCLILISNCGYTPIYSSQDLELNFKKIDYKNTKLNNQIARSLKSFSNNNGSKIYQIQIDTNKFKEVISKDSKGNPETLELKIILDLEITDQDNVFKKTFKNKLNYSDNANKFELSQYEGEIEKQIIDSLIKDIINYLLNLK